MHDPRYRWDPDMPDDIQGTGLLGQTTRNIGILLAGCLLIAGAFPVAIELYSYKVALMKNQGAPIEMVLAKEFVSAEASGVGISSRAKNPYTALLFARYHVDPKGGQTVLAQFGRALAHPDTKLKDKELQRLTAQDTLDRMSLLTAKELIEFSKPYTKIIKEIYNPAFRGQ
ncbi:MAG: hypothetical protein IH789_10675 [Acidobacteria bacterium]|nr:hypothetical protein [Acidobacteriota bacterium]